MIQVLREPLLTVKQVASQLGVTRQTVVNWITVGADGRKLEAVRLGRRYRITPSAIQKFAVSAELFSDIDDDEDRRVLAERFGL